MKTLLLHSVCNFKVCWRGESKTLERTCNKRTQIHKFRITDKAYMRRYERYNRLTNECIKNEENSNPILKIM